MNNLILIGAGGHAKSCIDVIEMGGKFHIRGLLDVKEKIGKDVLGYKIIGTDEDIEQYTKEGCYFLITVGQIKSPDVRIRIYTKLKKLNAKIVTVISPTAYVSKYVSIGEGTIIMHGVTLNAGVSVGANCIINTNALLEHDVKVGNHCHVSTSSVLNGDVVVGDNVFIGSNATIVQGTNIIDNTFVKAGSIVK